MKILADKSNKILLKNGKIIDENGLVSESRNIYISEGKIEKVTDQVIDGYEEIDCTGYYISPSFVNLHTHSPMNIMKGIAEDISIENWFNERIFPYESKLVGEDVYWGTYLAAAEMINNGVTAFADHYFFQEFVYKAVEDIGIRADIASNIFGLADDYEKQLEDSIEFVKKYKGKNERIGLRLGPHAPYTCPAEKLTEIINAAKELNVGIHIHLSETKEQVEDSIKLTGKTPFEVLYESGGFTLNTIIAHGLWLTEEDLKYLSDETFFALSPKTYMKLSMGKGNIYELKDSINYSFGTDGAASSNTLSPLEQARLFALNGKFLTDNPVDFKVEDIWKKLMDGHRALNFNTGKIKEGYSADLLIWDLNQVTTFPLYNELTSIIYSSTAENIKCTMVEGEFLKYDGKLKANVPNILENVKRIQENILLRGKGKGKVEY